MNFSVGKKAVPNFGDVNVGIAPGRFDAKQVVLTALAVMKYSTQEQHVRILRTIDKEELAQCCFFITDGFANKFPNIPSYNNISKVWEKYGEFIVRNIDCSTNPSLSVKYAATKICEIEKFDILLEYNIALLSSEDEDKKFEKAVEIAVHMITEIIKSSSTQAKSYYTIMNYIEKCEGDILYMPFDMNAKSVIRENAPNIEWLIIKESDDIYMIESTNKEVDIRQVVKDRKEVIYAGRFFCKVSSLEVANTLVKSIKAKIKKAA